MNLFSGQLLRLGCVIVRAAHRLTILPSHRQIQVLKPSLSCRRHFSWYLIDNELHPTIAIKFAYRVSKSEWRRRRVTFNRPLFVSRRHRRRLQSSVGQFGPGRNNGRLAASFFRTPPVSNTPREFVYLSTLITGDNRCEINRGTPRFAAINLKIRPPCQLS